jgi:ferredoxin-nitrate reductase
VQANNLHLIGGLLGRVNSGIYQMNGQPTAQNTSECGAVGNLPCFGNRVDEEPFQQLATLWKVPWGKYRICRRLSIETCFIMQLF